MGDRRVATFFYGSFLDALETNFPDGAVEPLLLFETSRGCWWGERSHCTFCGLNGLDLAYRATRCDEPVIDAGPLIAPAYDAACAAYDPQRALEAVWRLESARIIAGISAGGTRASSRTLIPSSTPMAQSRSPVSRDVSARMSGMSSRWAIWSATPSAASAPITGAAHARNFARSSASLSGAVG